MTGINRMAARATAASLVAATLLLVSSATLGYMDEGGDDFASEIPIDMACASDDNRFALLWLGGIFVAGFLCGNNMK
jgi:hypothetical protein